MDIYAVLSVTRDRLQTFDDLVALAYEKRGALNLLVCEDSTMITLHEYFGQNQGWSLEINAVLSIWYNCMERHHIQCVLLWVKF